ncbi:MAG: HAD-IA family hydrolase [bacterium]|nr:HAD-IA family hydrolase [bacterium]
MSYEEGVQKPDVKIYFRCMEKLALQAEDCLYVGDGGSNELEAAEAVGMTAVQAVWYLKDNVGQPCGRKEGFRQIENPLDILKMGI